VYPTDADWDAFEANFRADNPRTNPRLSADVLAGLMQDFLDRYDVWADEPLPLFGEIQADDQGRVWLPDFTPGINPDYSRYAVVSPEGEWLGAVEVPRGLHVLDISGGRVLGLMRDELDRESLLAYPISVVPVDTPTRLLAAADQAMYSAKAAGGDCVRVAAEPLRSKKAI